HTLPSRRTLPCQQPASSSWSIASSRSQGKRAPHRSPQGPQLQALMLQPVLIVGAGPVGLTAALSLAQQGVACRLIDRLPQRINQSRAAAIHARTCEQFERLGVIDPFLALGVKVHGLHVMDQTGRTLLRNNLDNLPTAYNFYLGLGQHET